MEEKESGGCYCGGCYIKIDHDRYYEALEKIFKLDHGEIELAHFIAEKALNNKD